MEPRRFGNLTFSRVGNAWRTYDDFEGHEVSHAILAGDAAILLLAVGESPPHIAHNLVKIDASGRLLWRAVPPGSPDRFQILKESAGEIWLETYYGYGAVVDVRTGVVTIKYFAK